jgi:hypothetical protein
MAGFEDLVAHPRDHPGGESPDRLLIIDHKNGIAADGAFRPGGGGGLPLGMRHAASR